MIYLTPAGFSPTIEQIGLKPAVYTLFLTVG